MNRLLAVTAVIASAAVMVPTAAGAPAAAEQSVASAAKRAEAAAVAQRQAGNDMSAQGLIGTPGVFADAFGDSSLAPDLRSMVVGVDETGTFGALIRLESNLLIDGDVVATYVDTDGNPATGSATFDGADIAVFIIGQTGPDSVGFLRWNGAELAPAPAPASLVSAWDGATDEIWTASLADLGIAPGTRVGVSFATLYIGLYDTYSDFAPEPGYGMFGVDIPAPAPVSPAPTSPAPTVPTTTVPGPIVIDGTPPPPAIQITGMGLRKLGRDVRVRLAWRGATTRRVTYRLELRCRGQVRAFGGPTRKGVAVSRRLRIPTVCMTSPVQVRATVTNGTHRVSITRTLP